MLEASASIVALAPVTDQSDMDVAVCIAIPLFAALLTVAVDCISCEQEPVELFNDWKISNPIHSAPRTPRTIWCERRSSDRIPNVNTLDNL